jgi:hypothetical protein
MALNLPELAHSVLHRSHRACLHRLRGDTQVLGGWAELGMMQKDQAKVRDRVLDGQQQMQRLELLWTYALQPAEEFLAAVELADFWHDARVQEFAIAEVFLAAAMRLGTPEEAPTLLPTVSDPNAAWATSMWLESVLGQSMSRQLACSDHQGKLRIRLQGTELQLAPDSLLQRYDQYLTAEPIASAQLGVDSGLWVCGLTTQKPAPAEPNPNAVKPFEPNQANADKPQ